MWIRFWLNTSLKTSILIIDIVIYSTKRQPHIHIRINIIARHTVKLYIPNCANSWCALFETSKSFFKFFFLLFKHLGPNLKRAQVMSSILDVQSDHLCEQLVGVLWVIYKEYLCEWCHMYTRGRKQYLNGAICYKIQTGTQVKQPLKSVIH